MARIHQFHQLDPPRAGAWIETMSYVFTIFDMQVAPRAGAWIETDGVGPIIASMTGRTPCGCVD